MYLMSCLVFIGFNVKGQVPNIPVALDSISTKSIEGDSVIQGDIVDSLRIGIADSLISADSDLESTVVYTAEDST
ncbi:MAG: hypothetical protein ACI8UX_002197, partial [Psychromonas sp.]